MTPGLKKQKIKLGTRRSLLAMAQSRWSADLIEKQNPDLEVELVGIETKGDQIQNVPLSKMEGKDFFIAEIDRALLDGSVDLTVHSMKDLSLDRPKEIALAAVPRRENPRDVILFRKDILERLKNNVEVKIGSSSPRRIENIPPFLRHALPHFHKDTMLQVEMVEIRGNVSTRIQKLKELDGVVLAFAGLIRLWRDQKGREELRGLLKDLRWMILPLDYCSAAPAQGALAIECRSKDKELLKKISKIHDAKTKHLVDQERALLREWGGGCHQRFGATAKDVQNLGEVMWVRGKRHNGERVEEVRWQAPTHRKATGALHVWNGTIWRKKLNFTKPKKFTLPKECKAYFIAHSRALPMETTLADSARVWTSGVSSWFRLAKQGVWVEGCSEGMGFDHLKHVFEEEVLCLPEWQDWAVLTHEAAVGEWESGFHDDSKGPNRPHHVVGTYIVEAPSKDSADSGQNPIMKQASQELQAAQHIYWSSGSQFKTFQRDIPPQATHACGPGKTLSVLITHGIKDVLVFPSVKEWQKWTGQTKDNLTPLH